MISTGHKDRAQAIVENYRRRASVTNVTEVNKTEVVKDLDRDEVMAMRRDFAAALETLALHYQNDLNDKLDDIKREFGTVLLKLNEAAEAELRRHDKG